MNYTYIKPTTVNIYKDSWKSVSKSLVFWLPIPFAIFLFPPIAIISVIAYVATVEFLRAKFWKDFAIANKWEIKESKDKKLFLLPTFYESPKNEQGLMFNQGHSGVISHTITGSIGNRNFRIFNYRFTIGSGKNSTTYYYTVFGFKYSGNFPHLYLNNKGNSYGISSGEKISLPNEFEKKFQLFAPRKYEIEALEIFTPDILAKMLDSNFSYDVEFVNQEILIYTDGLINNIDKLTQAFDKSLELQDMFINKLDKFKFEKIGDLEPKLF